VFENEDFTKVKVTPTEVVLAMKDWMDEDESQSAANFAATSGEPFARGFSDENYNYDKLTPRYKAKNARFDSIDELYLVHGVNDRFMAAFKNHLTIYPKLDSGLSINTDDPARLVTLILAVSDPLKPDPRLADPIFLETVIRKILAARTFAVFGMSVLDFVNIVEAAGVAVNPTIRNNPQGQRLVNDKSSTFRITAKGEAGSVTKTITAVIRTDDTLGKLLYWREE
jgi:general secretion pathway protein K